ncbi:hypothetical protein ACFOHK_15650 [Falsigemmobacter intermedius]|uniref:Uncharacterized protein n=1 Tax=Falsigemmobacter intermedius TaxID=1553448 RepID=A0A444M8L0_9RHOB|nr:hypothetical protein [Falsigemmobacter intermedius]RWY38790.1 hypothetical protein EP867_15410 [Falsigemmobacter intermedius]
MESANFSIFLNAFSILKAGYASNHAEISDLVEDAEFDEQHSQEFIQRSQQALLSPIARLDQELSWLPELSTTQINEIGSLLEAGKITDLREAIAFLPDLPKANVLAHLCGTESADETLLQDLLRAWDDVDQLALLEFLNSQRQAADFPKIESSQLAASIRVLESTHARSAALSVWRLDEPGKVMERLVEAELKRDRASRILAEFVREYDILSEPRLARISEAIDQQIELARQPTQQLEAVTSEIAELLRQWDDVNQPVQVFEQHQGHEEGRSKQIYERLRSLCLELANERGEFRHAKRLSEALLHTFPELESVAEVLKGDVEALENLDEQQKKFSVLEPLVAACEAAKSQVPKLKSALQSSGFAPARKGAVKEIFAAFDTAAKASGTGDAAFLVVRDLALFVNNDRNDPETAFRLIDGLITYRGAKPSQDVSIKLDEERSVLHRNWKMPELDRQSGNLGGMAKVVDEMLKYANGNDRAELVQLKSRIERKQAGKKVKWLIYGGIAAVIGFFVISDKLDRPTSRTSYQPTTTYQPSTPRQTTTSPSSNTSAETRPPVGQGLALNRAQVRYCVFQGERLEAMRSLTTTNYQISQFNALIDDYNSRCSNFQYTSGVLSSVRREAQGRTAEFTADARRIVASW